jgi:hypothetical protein
MEDDIDDVINDVVAEATKAGVTDTQLDSGIYDDTVASAPAGIEPSKIATEDSAISNDVLDRDDNGEERRAILGEVREHLDILKEFDGLISEEDYAAHKRRLYLALPSVPLQTKRKLEW